MKNIVQNIVFDFGRVICDFDHGKFVEFLKTHNAQVSSLADFYQKSQLLAYEAGQISTQQFINNVHSIIDAEVKESEVIDAWVNIFKPFPEMLSFMRILKTKYRVFVLSNTNELHWRYISNLLEGSSHAHDMLGSFQAGALKPDPKIFHSACERFKIQPAESVFIDDIAEYVDGARALGWHGIQHQTFATTETALKALGICVPGEQSTA